MHTYVIALDQGTTSSRAVVFDENAHIVAMKSYEFEQIYPQPGWVEHDPAAILNTQIDAPVSYTHLDVYKRQGGNYIASVKGDEAFTAKIQEMIDQINAEGLYQQWVDEITLGE